MKNLETEIQTKDESNINDALITHFYVHECQNRKFEE